MFKTVSKPLAHLNFLSGVNCYDIGSRETLTFLRLGFSTPPQRLQDGMSRIIYQSQMEGLSQQAKLSRNTAVHVSWKN